MDLSFQTLWEDKYQGAPLLGGMSVLSFVGTASCLPGSCTMLVPTAAREAPGDSMWSVPRTGGDLTAVRGFSVA